MGRIKGKAPWELQREREKQQRSIKTCSKEVGTEALREKGGRRLENPQPIGKRFLRRVEKKRG